jgi:hypothetical protein
MVAASYYTPTYFPVSYFYASSVTAPPSSTVMSPYNAPTYFSLSYFYGSPPLVPTTGPSEPRGHDQDAYSALLAMLKATGVFEEVILGAATQRSQAGADTYPLAVVTPKGWEEFDDYDPTSILRRASFSITVVVKSLDGGPTYDLLDQLSSTIQSVVDRSDLGGICLAPLTKIRAGSYDPSTHYPEQTVDLEGGFSQLIDPLAK